MATPTSVKLDDELKGRVKTLAESRRRSTHWILREAIAQYVEREEKREAFRQEAVEAWNNYQATGSHANLDEMTTWLESWGTDDEQPAPRCHD